MKTSVFKTLTAISFGCTFTYLTLGHYYQAGAMVVVTWLSFIINIMLNRMS